MGSPEKQVWKKVALERINILFKQAELRPEFSKRYVQLARKIQTRYKVPMPELLKYRYCKKCGSYWNAKSVRIRTHLGKVVFTCLSCKTIRRKPYTTKVKAVKSTNKRKL